MNTKSFDNTPASAGTLTTEQKRLLIKQAETAIWQRVIESDARMEQRRKALQAQLNNQVRAQLIKAFVKNPELLDIGFAPFYQLDLNEDEMPKKVRRAIRAAQDAMSAFDKPEIQRRRELNRQRDRLLAELRFQLEFFGTEDALTNRATELVTATIAEFAQLLKEAEDPPSAAR